MHAGRGPTFAYADPIKHMPTGLLACIRAVVALFTQLASSRIPTLAALRPAPRPPSAHAHAQRCAYVCNMAVASEFRRQGVALQLIRAAEDLARLAAEEDMYLHLRFQVGWGGVCA